MSILRVDRWEQTVLDTFCLLGSTMPDATRIARESAGMRRHSERLLSILGRHKAFTFYAARLDELKTARVLSTEDWTALRQIVEFELLRYQAHKDLLAAELIRLSASTPAASQVLLLKGFGNSRFYSDPAVRWSRDIDVLASNWDDAFELLVTLRNQGYGFDTQECPWFKADFEHGRKEYGQAILSKSFDADFCRIDVHFGTYSAGFDRYLDLELATFAEDRVNGPRVLDPTATLLVMFAHALSDGYVSVKDINDAAAMARTNRSVSWSRLADELFRHSLTPQARILASHLRRHYDDERVVIFAQRLLDTADGVTKWFWQMHNRSWRRRAVVNAAYTMRSGLRSGRNPLIVIWRTLQCFAFYVRRLRVASGRRSAVSRVLLLGIPKADVARWLLRPEACAMLVHTAHPNLPPSDPAVASTAITSQSSPAVRGVHVMQGHGLPTVVKIAQDSFYLTWDLHVGIGTLPIGRSSAG